MMVIIRQGLIAEQSSAGWRSFWKYVCSVSLSLSLSLL